MIPTVFNLLIAMLFVSGLSMAAVGLYARRFVDRVPAAAPFILLMFGASAWSILYALDLLTPVLPYRVAYHNLRFLFLPFFSVLELWLVIAYVNRPAWLRRDWAALALVIPLAASALALTSPYHTLFRYNFSINLTGPVPVLQYSEGIGYQIYNLYSFALLALAIVLLVSETRKKGTLWEMPTLLLIAAMAFPTVLNYLSITLQVPYPGINLTPALLWIAAILYAIALFRYRFLDIVPIARSRLVEALGRPMLVLDAEERVIDLNPAAGSLVAITPAAAIGRKIDGIVPDWPEFLDLCRKHSVQNCDLARVRGSETRYYLGSTEPLLAPGGETEGHLIFLEDVTGLKRAEEALRQKTDTLKERVKELRCLYDIARIIETEQSVDAYLQNFADIIPSGWQNPDLTCVRIRVENQAVHSPNFRESSDKLVCPIMVHQKPVGEIEVYYLGGSGLSQHGSFLPEESDLINAIAERIGRMYERLQVEQALRQSEEKYRTIIEEMQDIFYRTDLAGKIIMLSPSAAMLAGYDSNDQIIGRDVSSLYADPGVRDRLLGTLRENGSVYAYPLDLKVRDGSIRHVTTSSHFYHDDRGEIAGVEGVIHDVTEQQRAEEALRMANKKLNLLSTITRHDIRNQLMALMAFLELSQDSGGNPEERADFLQRCLRITDTIQRQIAFTKDYEDLGVKAPVWQDVTALVGLATAGLPLAGIRIITEVPGLELFADPLVEKVFYNLVDNTLRYGGEKVTTIRITSRPEGSSLVLIYDDDGAGVPGQDKKVIFDRGVGKNTGLGLYLTREILGITGITIAETGVPGKGARFEMTVPGGGFRFAGRTG